MKQPPAIQKAIRAERKRFQSVMGAKAFISWVRLQPCIACGASAPSEPHHFGKSGMGLKCSDYLTVPLCTIHHRHWHDHRRIDPFTREVTESWFYRVQAEQLRDWLERGLLE